MFPFITLHFGSEKVLIPTFFIVLIAVAILVLYFNERRARSHFQIYFSSFKQLPFRKKHLYDVILLIMISSFLGSRAFHVIYEHPRFYFENPEEILYFWKGGYVFFGGFFLSLASVAVYCFFKAKKNGLGLFLSLGDFLAPSFSLSYALGRLGCFFEGCCFGRFCSLPWAVQLRHPTQLYAFFYELIVFALLTKNEKHFQKQKGHLFIFWIFMHSAGRWIMESFRADFRGANYYGVSISAWISLSLMTLCGLWLYSYRRQK